MHQQGSLSLSLSLSLSISLSLLKQRNFLFRCDVLVFLSEEVSLIGFQLAGSSDLEKVRYGSTKLILKQNVDNFSADYTTKLDTC